MADPLSITASATSLLHVTVTASAAVYGYIREVKRAKKDMQSLAHELSLLTPVLTDLEKAAKLDPQSKTLQQLIKPNGQLHICFQDLVELNKQLERKPGKWGARGSSLAWPLKANEVADYLRKLESHKTYILLCLNTET